jgi:hypothetical protein
LMPCSRRTDAATGVTLEAVWPERHTHQEPSHCPNCRVVHLRKCALFSAPNLMLRIRGTQ